MQAEDSKNKFRYTNLISAFHQESRSRYQTLEIRQFFSTVHIYTYRILADLCINIKCSLTYALSDDAVASAVP